MRQLVLTAIIAVALLVPSTALGASISSKSDVTVQLEHRSRSTAADFPKRSRGTIKAEGTLVARFAAKGSGSFRKSIVIPQSLAPGPATVVAATDFGPSASASATFTVTAALHS